MLLLATEMFSRLEQHENAELVMSVTELGMLMLVRLEQPMNAPPLMFVTELGMLMAVRLEQPSNASTVAVIERAVADGSDGVGRAVVGDGSGNGHRARVIIGIWGI